MVAAPLLRIVFFGTPAFALPSLEALFQSRHRVVGVVTQLDRPRDRGHRTGEPLIKSRAARAGVPVLQPDRLKDPKFLEALARLNPDLGVVAAYGKILNEAVLAVPRLGFVNVHASLLPRYRGAAPIHRAVINGERETGVTIMRVVKALDAGPMLAVVKRPIDADETSEDVERDLARLGASVLIETVDALANGPIDGVPQDDSAATYAARLTKEEGAIDWTQSADTVHNLVRGLHPWPHAFTFYRGRRLIILRTVLSPGAAAPPGTILQAIGDHLQVATGRGAVTVREIQVESKRPMGIREFLAGHEVNPGEMLTSRP